MAIDSQNLILNFSEPITSIDSQNVILNFGSDAAKNVTAFFIAEVPAPILLVKAAQVLPITFTAEIAAPVLSVTATFDFNVERYTTSDMSASFEQSQKLIVASADSYQSVDIFDDQFSQQYESTTYFDAQSGSNYGVVISLDSANDQVWQKSNSVELQSESVFESQIALKELIYGEWQETIQLEQSSRDHYVDHLKFRKKSLNKWHESVSQGITNGFGFNATTWVKLLDHLVHQQTKYPNTGLWVPKSDNGGSGKTEYVGTGDLNFICKLAEVDPLNVVLNFSDHPCPLPPQPPATDQKVYFIMNEAYLKRVSDNVEIALTSVNVGIDRDSWCWSFSASVPYTEEAKVLTDGDSVEVELGLNGFVWRFLIESDSKSREFAKTDIKVSGRSVTALLDTEAGTRSLNQTALASSVQLAQNELERITSTSPFSLNWSLVDALGWTVPANAWSYTNLTPIKAIQQIAEGGGGFVSSHMSNKQLLIAPRYPVAPWQWSTQTPSINIPYSIILNESTSKDFQPDCNGIYLQAENAGVQAFVKKTGTSGSFQAPIIVDAFINDQASARSRGIAELSRFGKKRVHSLSMPLHTDIGVILPSNMVKVGTETGSWNGLSDAVSISANWGSGGLVIRQTVSIERYVA